MHKLIIEEYPSPLNVALILNQTEKPESYTYRSIAPTIYFTRQIRKINRPTPLKAIKM